MYITKSGAGLFFQPLLHHSSSSGVQVAAVGGITPISNQLHGWFAQIADGMRAYPAGTHVLPTHGTQILNQGMMAPLLLRISAAWVATLMTPSSYSVPQYVASIGALQAQNH